MKRLGLGIILFIWIVLTFILALSIIGWVLIVKVNDTGYYKYGEQCRTNWIQFGFDLKDAFLK